MGIVIVEVCESNPAAALNLESLEEEYTGTTVMRSSCLSECELCARTPFVMINGDIVLGEDLDSLMKQIRTKILEELTQWA